MRVNFWGVDYSCAYSTTYKIAIKWQAELLSMYLLQGGAMTLVTSLAP